MQVLDAAAISLKGSAVNASVPESERHRPMLGLACRLGAMATLGIMFALVKIAGNHGIHVVESLFWRQAAGLPVVLLWLWSMGGLRSIRTNRPMMHAVRMVLGLSGMALNFTAMLILPMAEATTIGFATPIFATVLAALLLREPTGRYRWGAVLIGFVGVMLAIRPGSTELPLLGTGISSWRCGAFGLCHHPDAADGAYRKPRRDCFLVQPRIAGAAGHWHVLFRAWARSERLAVARRFELGGCLGPDFPDRILALRTRRCRHDNGL